MRKAQNAQESPGMPHKDKKNAQKSLRLASKIVNKMKKSKKSNK